VLNLLRIIADRGLAHDRNALGREPFADPRRVRVYGLPEQQLVADGEKLDGG
jgi:hypothetical protein